MWCKSAAVGWVSEHLQRTCYVDSFSVVNTTAGESYTYVFQLCGDAGGVPGAGIIQVDSKGDAKKTTVIGMYNATQAFGGGKSVRRKPLCVSANWDYKRFYWLMYIMIPHLFLLNIVYDSLVKWQSFFSDDLMMLIYQNGEAYDSHCSKENRRAFVMISCNRDKVVTKRWIIGSNICNSLDSNLLVNYLNSVGVVTQACVPPDMLLSHFSILHTVFWCVLKWMYLFPLPGPAGGASGGKGEATGLFLPF